MAGPFVLELIKPRELPPKAKRADKQPFLLCRDLATMGRRYKAKSESVERSTTTTKGKGK
jgi:hypothetical protein